MIVTLRDENGRQFEGLLLAFGVDRMRVILRREKETQEFRKIEGSWVGDKGNTVEIDSAVFPSSEPVVMVRHA